MLSLCLKHIRKVNKVPVFDRISRIVVFRLTCLERERSQRSWLKQRQADFQNKPKGTVDSVALWLERLP